MSLDPDYRPNSYFHIPEDIEQLLLRNIKGENRRKILKEQMASGHDISEWLTAESLTDDDRKLWAGIHPSNMGGEYLPDLAEGEIELVRISMSSVLNDVVCIGVGYNENTNEYYYFTYDEYGEDGAQIDLPFSTSKEPLTFREVVTLIDETIIEEQSDNLGLVTGWNLMQLRSQSNMFWNHQRAQLSTTEMRVKENAALRNLLMSMRIESISYPNLTEYYNHYCWALYQFFTHKRLGIPGTENIGLLDYARKKREELFLNR